MKKKIIILIIILLFTTGCTCEYNLTINENDFQEKVTIIGNTQEEISNLDNKWKIPVNKEEFNITEESIDSSENFANNQYNYSINSNKLVLDYNFSLDEISLSSAISRCYNTASISKYDNSLIISTSKKANCYDNYPGLADVKINIITNKKVTSNNADSINGTKYIWNITKSNSTNKPINMVIDLSKDSSGNDITNQNSSSSSKNNKNNKTKDYSMYIFSGILLIIMLVIYIAAKKIKNKNEMDD